MAKKPGPWDILINGTHALKLKADSDGQLFVIMRTEGGARLHCGVDDEGRAFYRLTQGKRKLDRDERAVFFDEPLAIAQFEGSSVSAGLGLRSSTGTLWATGPLVPPGKLSSNHTTILHNAGTISLAPYGIEGRSLPPGSVAIGMWGSTGLTVVLSPLAAMRSTGLQG